MPDPALAVPRSQPARGTWLAAVARQRELSLLAIMFVLGGMVSLAAPQFLTASNLSQVAVQASIIAVAAVGEALVILTRNVDLSVEATIGLVAYAVARLLELHAVDTVEAIAIGIGLGLVLGMVNGAVITLFKVPSIVATLGTLSIFRGLDFLVAGSHQVPVAGLPDGFTDASSAMASAALPKASAKRLRRWAIGTPVISSWKSMPCRTRWVGRTSISRSATSSRSSSPSKWTG